MAYYRGKLFIKKIFKNLTATTTLASNTIRNSPSSKASRILEQILLFRHGNRLRETHLHTTLNFEQLYAVPSQFRRANEREGTERGGREGWRNEAKKEERKEGGMEEGWKEAEREGGKRKTGWKGGGKTE